MVGGIENIVEEEEDEMISCLVLNAGVLLPVYISSISIIYIIIHLI